mgnify:CR=1 FL=1
MDAQEWSEVKFLRRYRYAHLRNKTNAPMSIKNEDRHGLANLKHEEVKPLDRLHVPPFLVISIFLIPISMVIYSRYQAEDEDIQKM